MGKMTDTAVLKGYLEDYLRQKGLPVRKPFRCLSPHHEDKHPSMAYNKQAKNVHCFACGVTYDLFDLIGLDYGLDNFVDQYNAACDLFDGIHIEKIQPNNTNSKKTADHRDESSFPFFVTGSERNSPAKGSSTKQNGAFPQSSTSGSERHPRFPADGVSEPSPSGQSSTPGTADGTVFADKPGEGEHPHIPQSGFQRDASLWPEFEGSALIENPPEALYNPARSSGQAFREGRQRPIEYPTEALHKFMELQQQSTGETGYFASRGISRESVERFGLFQTADRAVFPIIEGSQCHGWCGRALADDLQPRYKNSAGSLGIWNGDRLLQEGRGQALCITEGVIDAILLEQLGVAAVALCGSMNTGKLLRRLEAGPGKANGWQYLLCGDGDEAGRKMNEALRHGMDKLGLRSRIVQLPDGEDVASLYREDLDKLQALLDEREDDVYNSTSAAAALDAFFADVEEKGGREGISTGLPGLDKVLDGGLYPGLYVMGAISSLGKTSLALQMADFIAGQERDVLFISLEQSCFELMAKSLSRISATVDKRHALSARQLMNGEIKSFQQKQLLVECRELYARDGRSLFLREGVADISAGDIRRMVAEHLRSRGQAPVVVDYLQVLSPMDNRATDKQNTDRAVVVLKNRAGVPSSASVTR